ncbi:MAG: LysE family transporter [Candidatus Pacearchaeota archaeon]|jgi:threonine/homoserine/homoserine lactone efflux protein
MVTFLDAFILGVALTLPFGQVGVEIFRRGLNKGFLESAKTTLGAISAELTYFVIVYLGLAEFSKNQTVYFVLGILGVIILFYLGVDNLRDFFKKSEISDKKGIYKSAFISGYILTFVNPLNFFLWAGIIGGFIAQGASLFVSSGILLGDFLVFAAYAIVAGLGKKVISKKYLRYLSLVAGLFLIFYSLRLLYTLIFVKTI